MWMEFECGPQFLTETLQTRQHFFVDDSPGFSERIKLWQAFFQIFCGQRICWPVLGHEIQIHRTYELSDPLRLVTNLLLFRLRRQRCRAGAASVHSQDGSSRYFFSRTALNVPSFDGPSPTSGENSASPVIKSAVSNFPLHVNVPASRPTLPIRNSTGPENVTEFPSSRVHFASEGLAPPQTLDCASVTVRLPFPSFCASKRRKRCWSLAKVISIFQLPVTFGESAPARTKENVFTAITRIIARVAFTFFSTSNLICAQIHWVLRLQFTRSTAGTHELFSEFPSQPPSHATVRQAIH
jgi:hypothetical protein